MDGGWSVCLDDLIAWHRQTAWSTLPARMQRSDLTWRWRGGGVLCMRSILRWSSWGCTALWLQRRAANVSFHPSPWGLHGRDQAYPPGSALPWSLPGFVGGHQSTFRLRDVGAIMRDLGHERVDVLKLDIEGAEWAVLKALLATPKLLSGGAVRQLLIELHFVPQGAEVKPGGEHRQGQPPPLVGGPTTAAEVFEYNRVVPRVVG